MGRGIGHRGLLEGQAPRQGGHERRLHEAEVRLRTLAGVALHALRLRPYWSRRLVADRAGRVHFWPDGRLDAFPESLFDELPSRTTCGLVLTGFDRRLVPLSEWSDEARGTWCQTCARTATDEEEERLAAEAAPTLLTPRAHAAALRKMATSPLAADAAFIHGLAAVVYDRYRADPGGFLARLAPAFILPTRMWGPLPRREKATLRREDIERLLSEHLSELGGWRRRDFARWVASVVGASYDAGQRTSAGPSTPAKNQAGDEAVMAAFLAATQGP